MNRPKRLKELPELKVLVKELLVEVKGLRNASNNTLKLSKEFISNKINVHNRRANNNLIFKMFRKMIQTGLRELPILSLSI